MKYKMSKKYNYKNKIKESELQYIMYIFVQFGMKSRTFSLQVLDFILLYRQIEDRCVNSLCWGYAGHFRMEVAILWSLPL